MTPAEPVLIAEADPSKPADLRVLVNVTRRMVAAIADNPHATPADLAPVAQMITQDETRGELGQAPTPKN